VHFVISFTNGQHMALSDMRKFAKITLLDTATAHLSEHLVDIGPEPLEKSFDFKKFKARLLTRPKGKIKQVLMEPAVVSGIGNIYSDEILWDAGVHPLSIVSKIPEKELRKIFASTKLLLKKGIQFGGDSMSDYRTPIGTKGSFQHHHKAYHKFGEKCAKKGCRGTISKLKAGGRTTHFCATHQKCYN
jgi:formamidopyrimidine-DNA glycosylase